MMTQPPSIVVCLSASPRAAQKSSRGPSPPSAERNRGTRPCLPKGGVPGSLPLSCSCHCISLQKFAGHLVGQRLPALSLVALVHPSPSWADFGLSRRPLPAAPRRSTTCRRLVPGGGKFPNKQRAAREGASGGCHHYREWRYPRPPPCRAAIPRGGRSWARRRRRGTSRRG